jgi:sortase A
MVKQADLYSPDEAAKMLVIPSSRLFGMLASGELEGHQDKWARWRLPARAIRRACQDPEPPSGPGGSSEDDAESRIAEEGDAPSSEETTQTVEELSEEERHHEEQDRERRLQSGIDGENNSEVEITDGLPPPSGNGETPAPEAAHDKTKGEGRPGLGIVVLGLASVTLLAAGLALVVFYFVNQEPQNIATNSSDPEGLNVPEIEAPQEETNEVVAADAPEDKTLWVTVASMERIKDAPVPDTYGTNEESLKNYVGIHLQGAGFPWQEEANVYLAGHRLGYPGTSSWLGFWDLDNVKEGDEVMVTDANGEEYTYEVFTSFVATPNDVWVLASVPGKNILTLQTCTLPDYSQRLIVQAELVEEA